MAGETVDDLETLLWRVAHALRRTVVRAAAVEAERFRRNRAYGVLIGGRRAAVLIPVDGVTDRATRGGAGIAQGDVTPRSNTGERIVRLIQVVTVLVRAQEGVGDAGQCLRSAAKRRGAYRDVHRSQKIVIRGIPVNEMKAGDGAASRERVANGKAKVDDPGIGGAVVGTVVIQGLLLRR